MIPAGGPAGTASATAGPLCHTKWDGSQGAAEDILCYTAIPAKALGLSQSRILRG